MRVTIIRFEGSYAICMKEDNCIVDIKRINIPVEAEEGDILKVGDSSVTIEKKVSKEKYIHVDDIIIDQW